VWMDGCSDVVWDVRVKPVLTTDRRLMEHD
jgi:hypothetical protein